MIDPTQIYLALKSEIFASPLEGIATLLGIANIILLVRRSIWNYPAGILSVTLFAYVFFHTQLFSDTLLQVFFIVVQIIGWVVWLRHQEPDGELIVEKISFQQAALALCATAAGALLLGFGMKRYAHAAFPYWDATVAAASVIGQLLLTWRKVENWFWWIGSNIISIVIYSLKGLHITSGLYVFYMVMSILGFIAWKSKLATQRELVS